MKCIPVVRRLKYEQVISLSYILVLVLMVISCGSQEKLTESNLLINDKPQDIKAFEKLIWSRNADSIIIINKKNLNKICRNTQTGEDVYFSFLHSYSIQITSVNPISKQLSISDRAYIAAYAVDYLYRCQKKMKAEDPYKDSKFVNRFLAPWSANKYNREFEKHNYYGLKLLKKHHLKHYFQYSEEDTIPSIKRVID